MKGERLLWQTQDKLQRHHTEHLQYVRLTYGSIKIQTHHTRVGVGKGREVHIGIRFKPRHGRGKAEVWQRDVCRVKAHMSLSTGHTYAALLTKGATVECKLKLSTFLCKTQRVDAQRHTFKLDVVDIKPFLSQGKVVVVCHKAVTPIERAYLVNARTKIDVAICSTDISESDTDSKGVAGHVYLDG